MYEARDVKLIGAFYSPAVYNIKAQYSFGWDRGPRLPTSGIWRLVWLKAYNICKIDSSTSSRKSKRLGIIEAVIEVGIQASLVVRLRLYP